MMYQTDLSVRIAGAEFKNPVMPASGAYDYFDANANVFPMRELGAVMVKSVHRMVRPASSGKKRAQKFHLTNAYSSGRV